ncbi:hypothetical protein Tco_0863794, partial [Tanacetum coccineum]
MNDGLSIVETDKVIHTVETGIVKLVVEIESSGMSFDEFGKGTRSSDRFQPKKADLSCVHALNKFHLHEIHVVPTIMEGLISNNESGNNYWKRWKSHEIYYHDYDEGEYENETHEEGHELCGIETREVPVCQIQRYKMIKYSFNNDEEYVAVKEDEYDDLTITSKE